MRDSPTPRSNRPTSLRQNVARWLLALAVFGSAMALGALHTTVLIVVTLVLAAATAVAWWGVEPMRARPAATIVFWVGILLLAWTALQCVPLPASWLAAIAPANADVWARALTPLREPGPQWVTISLDPVATRIQVLRGVAYLLAFVTALRLANRREGVSFLEGTIVLTGAALAVAAWVHPVVGAERVFGVYKPVGPTGLRHIAPLLNANILAGYLNIAFCLALAEATAIKSAVPRVLSVSIVALLFATQLWVASRGGMMAMALGAILVVWMGRIATRSTRRSAVALLAIPVTLVVAGVAMAVLSGSEEAWQELADADVSKLELAKRALAVVPTFPIFGMGRGAFESVFPAFRVGAGHIVFTQPENIVAQWLTEWGAVVGVGAFAALGYALRPATAMARSSPAAGAWAAIACVVVHNLVDFSSELPAAMIALAVCGAIVLGGTAGINPRFRLEAWSRWPRALASMGCLLALGGIALARNRGELNEDREGLRADALDRNVSRPAFHAEVREAMLRHPAEPYLPFTGGLRASRVRDESVVPWVERTLERAPVYGPAHFLLARELGTRAPAQARLEYRMAMMQDDAVIGPAVTEGIRLVRGYFDAMELAPRGQAGIFALEAIAQAINSRLPASRVRVDQEIRERDSSQQGPALRALADAREDVTEERAAPWCAGDRPACLRRGLGLADQLERIAPNKCASYVARANLVALEGDSAGALTLLENAGDKVADRPACMRELVLLSVKLKDDTRATASLDRLARMGCATDAECVDDLVFVAEVELGRNNRRRALAFYEKAVERAPQREDLLGQVAALASDLGLHAEALAALHKLGQVHPDRPGLKEATSREQHALVGEALSAP
jgi:tetratricopeptide (TPR) repeat protein